MRTSKHGKKRIKERCGVGKSSADRLANIVLDKGYTRAQTTGRLRKYLDSLYHSTTVKRDIRVYGDKVYLFSGKPDKTLVTVIQLPQNLTKDMKHMIKEKMNE